MAPDTLSLQGKVAIITGSGRENGIGAGIALALARNGASVTINYVSDSTAPRAVNVARLVEEAGGKATVVKADISTPEGAESLVQETLKAFETDTIDILGGKSFFSFSFPPLFSLLHGKHKLNTPDA
jgi:NAD(P)-dependent dehydrogenase (short-subunit alcohol dehydrogenase family)